MKTVFFADFKAEPWNSVKFRKNLVAKKSSEVLYQCESDIGKGQLVLCSVGNEVLRPNNCQFF